MTTRKSEVRCLRGLCIMCPHASSASWQLQRCDLCDLIHKVNREIKLHIHHNCLMIMFFFFFNKLSILRFVHPPETIFLFITWRFHSARCSRSPCRWAHLQHLERLHALTEAGALQWRVGLLVPWPKWPKFHRFFFWSQQWVETQIVLTLYQLCKTV